MQQRARELDPSPVAAAQLRGLVLGALGEAEAGEFARDALLSRSARDAVQAGMKQQVRGDR